MDKLSPERRSANTWHASAVRTRAPNSCSAELIHGLGYRFRLHRKDLPGKPDLVFPSRRKVIFVHEQLLWHQHPECKENGVPASRSEYWGPKTAPQPGARCGCARQDSRPGLEISCIVGVRAEKYQFSRTNGTAVSYCGVGARVSTNCLACLYSDSVRKRTHDCTDRHFST